MNKKVKIIVLTLVIVVILIIGIVFIVNSSDKKNIVNVSLYDKIVERLDKGEDLLIYVTDEESKCYLCPYSSYFIKFYEDEYDLEFVYFNKSENSKEDFDKLIARLEVDISSFVIPAVIIAKDGKGKVCVNEIATEKYLRQYLIDYGFVDDKYERIDSQISVEDFKEKYASSEKNVIALYTYVEDSYKIRDSLLKLNKKYDFSYDVVYYGVSEGIEIGNMIMLELGEDFDIPLLVIVQNGKIVDYVSTTKEDKLLKFLQKNKIIT